MSQTKAQLIEPIGVVTASGVVVSGVATAVSFDGEVVGSATSIIQGKNLNLGAVNAVSFSGDFTGNATGIITSSAIKVGQLTASSFVGDFTGTATSMARGTGFEAGTVTSTAANVTYTVTVSGGDFYLDSLQQPTPTLYPGATYTFDQSDSTNGTHPLRFATAADAAGSTEYTDGVTTNGTPGSAGAWTKIVVPRNAPTPLYYYCTNHSGMGASINITNKLQGAVTGDVTGSTTGIAGTVVQGTNIHVGVVTATSLYGDGSNLTGIAATNFNTQTVTIGSTSTSIDLSAGNMITLNQNTSSTVSFANTSEAMDVTFIRPGGGGSYNISLSTGGVDFDGTDDDLATTLTTAPGTSDFTLEYWVKQDTLSDWQTHFATTRGDGFNVGTDASGDFVFFTSLGGGRTIEKVGAITTGVWYHWAFARTGGTTTGYLNGVAQGSFPDTYDYSPTSAKIGNLVSGSEYTNGVISNLRLVVGTALYTSNFVPPTAALTNVDNTKLLCCQSTSDATAKAVGGTITASSSPTAGAQTITASGNYPTQGNITWPSGVRWNGSGVAPRTGHANEDEVDQFQMLTRDSGVTWYAWEPMDIDYDPKYEAYTFGDDENGTLAQNTENIKKSSPVHIGGSWIDVSANYRTWIMSKPNGSLWAVGFNPAGQCAQNSTNTAYSSPIQIGTDTNWSLFNKGGSGTGCLSTKIDGTLWVWGKNDQGALGQNQAEAQLTGLSSPMQIPGTYRTTRGAIAETRAQNNAVIKADGTLWAWGSNEFGELGLNNKTQYSSPTQMGARTDWASVWGGGDSMMARRTDATGWVWGRNYGGFLGLSQPNNAHYSSPVQLPGNWLMISRVGGLSCGIKFTYSGDGEGAGTLWTWGQNAYGQLGHNSASPTPAGPSNNSSPKQVGTSEDWRSCIGNWSSAIATKKDGSLWAWGYNDDSTGAGNLGQNNTIEYSSPVQIPGTDWKAAYGSYGTVWALKGDNRSWTPRFYTGGLPSGSGDFNPGG